ncbi:MAG TPA: heme exporter protein CcmD [Patescibacteria group bacterium]|nr:heme exporter protein CcmD [Patescibacteria group bacterium]
MNHTPFIVASYAVFAAFLIWDFVSPRLALRRLKHELGARAARVERRKNR